MDKIKCQELIETFGYGKFPYLDNKVAEKKRDSLTVREYIDIIKQHKELHLFKHHLWLLPLKYKIKSEDIFLLFNTEGAKMLTGIGYEIEKDDEFYKDYIEKTIDFIELEI